MIQKLVSLLLVLAVLPTAFGAGLDLIEVKPTAPPTPPPQPPPPTPTPKPPAPPTPEPARAADPLLLVQPSASPSFTNTPVLPSTTPAPSATSSPPTVEPTRMTPTLTNTPSPTGAALVLSPTLVAAGSAVDAAKAWVGRLPTWVPSVVVGSVGILLVTLAWWVVRYAYYTRQQLSVQRKLAGESEAARLEDQRREVERVLASDEKGWIRLAGQVVADVLRESVHLSREIPPRVSGKPAPYFTVAGEDGGRYVFAFDVRALQKVGLLPKRGVRAVRLERIVEPGLIWRWLAEKYLREPGDLMPAMPRDAEWFLVVVGR